MEAPSNSPKGEKAEHIGNGLVSIGIDYSSADMAIYLFTLLLLYPVVFVNDIAE